MCVFSLLFFKKTTAMTHSGWPHATAMAHGGCKAAACCRGVLQPPSATAVGQGVRPNRRGPRWLDLKPPWATAATMAHCNWLSKLKKLKLLYNFAKLLKKFSMQNAFICLDLHRATKRDQCRPTLCCLVGRKQIWVVNHLYP
jgi:hypothetical protein